MKASSTKLSLDFLRAHGYTVDVVEHWVPSTQGGRQVRRDLFGILDLVALRGKETLGVQTTTKGEVSKRAAKIANSHAIGALREAGWTIVVHGWWQPNGPHTPYECVEVECVGPLIDGQLTLFEEGA